MRPWLALAAGLVVLIGGGVLVTRLRPHEMATTQAAVVAPALDELSDAELSEVLDSLSWQAPASAQLAGTLDDLDATELATLLTLLEG
jgi:hypothetical protein